MERKWLVLANDPLPLRLGQKVMPDAAALRLPVPEPDVGVRWVGGGPFMGSDYAHPVAPDCRNKTKAKVERAADTNWKQEGEAFNEWLTGKDVRNAPPVYVDFAIKDEPAPMLFYTYLDSAGRQHSTASPATDEEVKAHYKDRALGRPISEDARLLFEARVALRGCMQPQKTATGLQILMDAEERERRRRGNCCPGCGVNEGDKHFLSCWMVRPDLLA